MLSDTHSGVGSGGFDQGMGGDKQLTISSVIKEFQGLKDKLKNEDEDECEWGVGYVCNVFCPADFDRVVTLLLADLFVRSVSAASPSEQSRTLTVGVLSS